MTFIDYLILAAIGVPFVVVWILLVRASIRGGCGTSSCQLGGREEDEDVHEQNAG
jgi:hypothetical protein